MKKATQNTAQQPKRIRLSRTSSGWAFYGFSSPVIITRHEWQLPYTSVSYRAIINGEKIETDTLRDMRECIAGTVPA